IRDAEATASEVLQRAAELTGRLEDKFVAELAEAFAHLRVIVRVLELQRRRSPPDEALEQAIQKGRDVQALLENAGRAVRAMHATVALTIEPKWGFVERWRHRARVRRFLREQNAYGDCVERTEAQMFDGVRVAEASPLYWIDEARG